MILARNYCDWFKTYVLIVSRDNMPVLYIEKPINMPELSMIEKVSE